MTEKKGSGWKKAGTLGVVGLVAGLAGNAVLGPAEFTQDELTKAIDLAKEQATKDLFTQAELNEAFNKGIESVEVTEVEKLVEVPTKDPALSMLTELAFEEILDDFDLGYDEDEISIDEVEEDYTVEFDDKHGDWIAKIRLTVEYDDNHDEDFTREYAATIEYDADDDDYDVEIRPVAR